MRLSYLCGWQIKDILKLTAKQLFLSIQKFEKFKREELIEASVSRAQASAVAFGSLKPAQFQRFLEKIEVKDEKKIEPKQDNKEMDRQIKAMKMFGIPVEDK